MSNREWMRVALEEAAAALLHDDVPVGAVVVDGAGMCLGRAHNERERRKDPTAHAEVLALQRAAHARGEWRLEGCVLVTTLEPCVMCAGAAMQSRVARVVYGAPDRKAGAAGSLWDLFADPRSLHRPQVEDGLLAPESAALLQRFFHRQRSS